MILAIIAAAAAAQPAPLKLFRDWAVGCDNGGVCQAVSLAPARGDPSDWWNLHLARGPAAGAQPAFALELGEGDSVPAALAADGRKLPVRLTARGGRVEIEPAEALIPALRSARRIEALDGKGRPAGAVSLAGASAALLYIDERQQRIGTASALARPGATPASPLVPAAWPLIAAAPQSRNAPRALPAAEARRWTDELCADEPDKSGRTVKAVRLDPLRSLAILPASCLSGEYNDASLLLVAGDNGRWTIAPVEGARGTDPADLVVFGAEWRGGRLETRMAGRSLGDCGVRQTYAWDGSRLRLVDQWEMGECRGAHGWIRTWHAEVR